MAGKLNQLVADAVAHHEAGRLDQAKAAYRAALDISPGHAAITHNLGVVAAAQGDPRSAIAHFDRAIAAEPQYASAHYNRASALQTLGQTREAIQGFARACTIEPGHYDAHRALGFLWLAEGNRGRALDHFARIYELRRGVDRTGLAAKSLTWAARDKLLHDAGQFRYLAERRRDRQRFEALARNYETVAKDIATQAAPLSDEQLEELGEDYNTAIHIADAPELPERAVSVRPDSNALMRDFERQKAALVRRPADAACAARTAALSARKHDLA